MVQIKDLTEVTVRELWREFKDEEDWWDDLNGKSLRLVRRRWRVPWKRSFWSSFVRGGTGAVGCAGGSGNGTC